MVGAIVRVYPLRMPRPAPATQRVLRQIAANVRRRRANLGLTQEQLAEDAGFDTRFLQRIEYAQVHMRIETLLRLATALDLDAADLLRVRPNPKLKRLEK